MLLDLFLLLVVMVLSNVLIAIVSDSYDEATAESEELFWRARFELVAETLSVCVRASTAAASPRSPRPPVLARLASRRSGAREPTRASERRARAQGCADRRSFAPRRCARRERRGASPSSPPVAPLHAARYPPRLLALWPPPDDDEVLAIVTHVCGRHGRASEVGSEGRVQGMVRRVTDRMTSEEKRSRAQADARAAALEARIGQRLAAVEERIDTKIEQILAAVSSAGTPRRSKSAPGFKDNGKADVSMFRMA